MLCTDGESTPCLPGSPLLYPHCLHGIPINHRAGTRLQRQMATVVEVIDIMRLMEERPMAVEVWGTTWGNGQMVVERGLVLQGPSHHGAG